MTTETTFTKASTEVLDYTIDWLTDGWLSSGETISTTNWVVPAGITKDSDSENNTTTTIWLSGGTDGAAYTLTNTITTSGNKTGVRSVVVMIRNTPRAGMVNLISQLRGFTQAGEGDYTVKGVSYWTDEQLQAVLDRHHRDIFNWPLNGEPELYAGDTVYKDYYLPGKFFEESTSGETAWRIHDGSGVTITDSHTIDYNMGHIRFAADRSNDSSVYIRCRAYNLYAAAAEIWRTKAAHVTQASYSSNIVEWSSDNHTVKRNSAQQSQTTYMSMARDYDRMAIELGGGRNARKVRSDLL